MNNEPKTLMEAIKHFSDPVVCHDFVVSMVHPKGVTCPHCAGTKIGEIKSRQMFQCKTCRKQFSVKLGTIFEDSPIKLDKWLGAIWMIANCKNGVSSCEIARELGVTQKTGWFMLHRVRLAMQGKAPTKKLGGVVEVDETFIGGKARNMHTKHRKERLKGGRGTAGKTAVFGLLERHTGTIRTEVINSRKKGYLDPKVRVHVEPGTEVHTDALGSYNELNSEYVHKVVDHAECYVKEGVHTNGMENYWSLLKRTIRGTYVSVEPYHLFRYLDEQSMRFNTRKISSLERFKRVVSQIVGKRLTYKKLIGEVPSVC